MGRPDWLASNLPRRSSFRGKASGSSCDGPRIEAFLSCSLSHLPGYLCLIHDSHQVSRVAVLKDQPQQFVSRGPFGQSWPVPSSTGSPSERASDVAHGAGEGERQRADEEPKREQEAAKRAYKFSLAGILKAAESGGYRVVDPQVTEACCCCSICGRRCCSFCCYCCLCSFIPLSRYSVVPLLRFFPILRSWSRQRPKTNSCILRLVRHRNARSVAFPPNAVLSRTTTISAT